MGNSYTNYYGLIFNCPVDTEVTGCAFKKLRQLSTSKERLTYFESLSVAEKMNMIAIHQRCLSVREKKSLFHESQ